MEALASAMGSAHYRVRICDVFLYIFVNVLYQMNKYD